MELALFFRFPRPRSHFLKSGLRPNAPGYVTRTPDIDKLARAALDALTGVAFLDDKQVAVLRASKEYSDDRPGLHVAIRELPERRETP